MKIRDFLGFPGVLLLDFGIFARWPVTNGWSPYQERFKRMFFGWLGNVSRERFSGGLHVSVFEKLGVLHVDSLPSTN